MQTANKLSEYRKECTKALDNDYLTGALDRFAVAYRGSRAKAFCDYDEPQMIKDVADMKDGVVANFDSLYDQFKASAEAKGITVHYAKDAEEANQIIVDIAKKSDCKKIVKSKSMTSEETLLNHFLEDNNLEVSETDLGEYIIQLRHEGPSHMVMPAIHLSRYQIQELFEDVSGEQLDPNDIEKLVRVARLKLRQDFFDADMGITGANFAIADSGTIGLVTNEGNDRLVTTLPKVHVALFGIDKLVPTVADAQKVVDVLPKNATGQGITSYVTWVSGTNESASSAGGTKETHYIMLDNGRKEMMADPLFSQVFRCVRCGACANICPVYRLVGGHKLGHIYIGAIGTVLTYFFHGKDKAKNIAQNCINCEACKNICAGDIDLPRLIKTISTKVQDEDGIPIQWNLMAKLLKNRTLFHTLLKNAQWATKPFKGKDGFSRHLPMFLFKEHDFKALPTVADKAFRDIWPTIQPKVENPKYRVALFAGCVQDFVYPEQMVAAAELLAAHGVELYFPKLQTCCGLPVQMVGEMNVTKEIAQQNLDAFGSIGYDYVLTLCASCGSHLKHAYPKLMDGDGEIVEERTANFSSKVIDFSSFVRDVLKLDASHFVGDGKKTTIHSPCHLCRGLNVKGAVQDLVQSAGMEYIKAEEEETCCGFGGTYSAKFPELSATILAKKLDDIESTGADMLLTDCPGCVMQLRGGLEKRGSKIEVKHTAEALAERRK